MSDNMTRVQAICACRNILRLCDENEKVPEDMASGIADRTRSMEKRITETTRYPSITEGMDNALRNMWNGLRKWDRDDEFIDDIFDDLDAVEEEVTDLDASGDNKPPPKGRETGEKSEELAKKFGGGEGTKSGRFPADKPNEADTPKPGFSIAGGPDALLKSDILRRKESAVSFVLDEIHKAALTLVDKGSMRSMTIADVLNMTKSDRNQQLIRAAYYIGVLRGVKLLNSKIQNGDG